MSRKRFRFLMQAHPLEWEQPMLDDLTQGELAAICELFGVARTGTKDKLKDRIWKVRHLRLVLAPYGGGDDTAYEAQQAAVEQLAENYTAEELRVLCVAAGVYAGDTKYARAAALLQWRNTSRARGTAALDAARAAAREEPRQLALFKDSNAKPPQLTDGGPAHGNAGRDGVPAAPRNRGAGEALGSDRG